MRVGRGMDRLVVQSLISVDSEILAMETNVAFVFDFSTIEKRAKGNQRGFLPREPSGNTVCNEQQAQWHTLAGQGAKDENSLHALG